MFAIIESGGKQYKIKEGDRLKIEKVSSKGDAVIFDKVLLVGNDSGVTVGTPVVAGATVEAKLLKEGRADKKIVFRYHSKTRYRKMKGHRQSFAEVEITRIKE